jgi:hypothetical protein
MQRIIYIVWGVQVVQVYRERNHSNVFSIFIPYSALTFVDSEPQTVIMGKNVVEINEQHYLSNVEKLINQKLRVSKVPGPWRDQPKTRERPVSPRLLELKNERIQEILNKTAAKNEARMKMLKAKV